MHTKEAVVPRSQNNTLLSFPSTKLTSSQVPLIFYIFFCVSRSSIKNSASFLQWLMLIFFPFPFSLFHMVSRKWIYFMAFYLKIWLWFKMAQPFFFQRYISVIPWSEILHDNRRKHKTKDLEEWMKTVWVNRHLIPGHIITAIVHYMPGAEGYSTSQLYSLSLHEYSSPFLHFPHLQYNPPHLLSDTETQIHTLHRLTLWNHILKMPESNSLNPQCHLQIFAITTTATATKKIHDEIHHLLCPTLKAIKIKLKKKWHHTSLP